MAGGGGDDNPVAINVTAMVDVIFCLCLFFMCSMHFKQLEGKMETWLPTGDGNQPHELKTPPLLEEVRVFLRWDGSSSATIRKVGSALARTDDDLVQNVMAQLRQHELLGRKAPVLIDATEDVPWNEVIHVVDLCKQRRVDQIKFVEPMQFGR